MTQGRCFNSFSRTSCQLHQKINQEPMFHTITYSLSFFFDSTYSLRFVCCCACLAWRMERPIHPHQRIRLHEENATACRHDLAITNKIARRRRRPLTDWIRITRPSHLSTLCLRLRVDNRWTHADIAEVLSSARSLHELKPGCGIFAIGPAGSLSIIRFPCQNYLNCREVSDDWSIQ